MSKDDKNNSARWQNHMSRIVLVVCFLLSALLVCSNTYADTEDSWICPNCGKVNTKLFCGDCGTKKPDPSWLCICGNENTTRFCENCGRSKEEGFQDNSSTQKSTTIPSNTINRMFGTWESNQGDKFIFRADGTCNINGEELYYITKNWTFHTGQNANSMSTTYRIVSNNSKRCTLRITSGNDVGKTYILTATTTKESTTTPTKEPTASPTKKSTETPTKKPAIYNDYFFLELSEGWIYVSKSNLWINYNDKNRPGLLILDVCEEEGISISSLLQQQFINNWIAQIEKDNPEQVAYEDFSFLGIDTMLIQYQSDHKHYYHLPFWINNRVYILIYMVVADRESNVDRSEVIRIANNIQVIASTLKPTATPSKPVVTPTKKPTATPTMKPITTSQKNITNTFSIRNGFHYNSTVAEVQALERKNGSKQGDGNLQYSVTVGGVDCDLQYFPSNGIVNEFQYQYVEFNKNIDYMSYSKILSEKYGKPLYTRHSDSKFRTNCLAGLNKYLSGYSTTYYAWLQKYDDCYLFVELVHTYGTIVTGFTASFMDLNYKLYSYDEVNAVITQTQMENESINYSLNNDL